MHREQHAMGVVPRHEVVAHVAARENSEYKIEKREEHAVDHIKQSGFHLQLSKDP